MSQQRTEQTRYPGIVKVHARGCDPGSKCNCKPSYQATIYSAREGKRVRKHHASEGAAKTWREDASKALRDGKLKLNVPRTTVAEAGVDLIAGMRSGAIYDKSGRRYKPSTIRSYEIALRLHVTPWLGHRPVAKLERREVQALVGHLHGGGMAASTVHNALSPLRVLCMHAIDAGHLAVDPTKGLRLPAVRSRRDRVATRAEAEALLDALPAAERALWGVAFYGGLRLGELKALRWSDVDLASSPAVIVVRRTWDEKEGEVAAKTEAGERVVPLAGRLRTLVVEHGLATARGGGELVFGRTATLPFTITTMRDRARKAWAAAGLEGLTPHEARHTCASYLIEMGINDLELASVIGHADPRTTKRIYGHLFADSRARIAAMMDGYYDSEPAR